MGLSDIAGVFSRLFIVGFLLPAFFVLLVVSQLVTSDFLPAIYDSSGNATRVLLIGGAALLVGLLLLGLNYPILRLYEGYPLRELVDRPGLRWLYRLICTPERNRFGDLTGVLNSETKSNAEKGKAAWVLDRHFPIEAEQILPTRFGNAVQAFEHHSLRRWGLDAIPAWPRIELMLTEDQREVQNDARSEVALFVNGALLAVVGGLSLIADGVSHRHAPIHFGLALRASIRNRILVVPMVGRSSRPVGQCG